MGINDRMSFKYSMGVNDSISFKYSMHALTPMGVNDSISYKYSRVLMIALLLGIA